MTSSCQPITCGSNSDTIIIKKKHLQGSKMCNMSQRGHENNLLRRAVHSMPVPNRQSRLYNSVAIIKNIINPQLQLNHTALSDLVGDFAKKIVTRMDCAPKLLGTPFHKMATSKLGQFTRRSDLCFESLGSDLFLVFDVVLMKYF